MLQLLWKNPKCTKWVMSRWKLSLEYVGQMLFWQLSVESFGPEFKPFKHCWRATGERKKKVQHKKERGPNTLCPIFQCSNWNVRVVSFSTETHCWWKGARFAKTLQIEACLTGFVDFRIIKEKKVLRHRVILFVLLAVLLLLWELCNEGKLDTALPPLTLTSALSFPETSLSAVWHRVK